MHVMAISSVPNIASFRNSLKAAHGQLPRGANWVIAIASIDGTKAVNVVVHESIGGIPSLFEEHIGDYATTDYLEADAANAVGLPAG
jgi:hypothetical protein